MRIGLALLALATLSCTPADDAHLDARIATVEDAGNRPSEDIDADIDDGEGDLGPADTSVPDTDEDSVELVDTGSDGTEPDVIEPPQDVDESDTTTDPTDVPEDADIELDPGPGDTADVGEEDVVEPLPDVVLPEIPDEVAAPDGWTRDRFEWITGETNWITGETNWITGETNWVHLPLSNAQSLGPIQFDGSVPTGGADRAAMEVTIAGAKFYSEVCEPCFDGSFWGRTFNPADVGLDSVVPVQAALLAEVDGVVFGHDRTFSWFPEASSCLDLCAADPCGSPDCYCGTCRGGEALECGGSDPVCADECLRSSCSEVDLVPERPARRPIGIRTERPEFSRFCMSGAPYTERSGLAGEYYALTTNGSEENCVNDYVFMAQLAGEYRAIVDFESACDFVTDARVRFWSAESGFVFEDVDMSAAPGAPGLGSFEFPAVTLLPGEPASISISDVSSAGFETAVDGACLASGRGPFMSVHVGTVRFERVE